MTLAKKNLGQNFLTSKKVVEKISSCAGIKNKDIVLEIGPGRGVLTEQLLSAARKVVAIEKDEELIPIIRDKFDKEILESKLLLVNEDVRKVKLQELGLRDCEYKLVANIPYYITGEIFRMFLGNKPQPETVVLLVQNEVAKRIVARDEKESVLSISIKSYGNPKYILKVPARYFSPKPKVDSAVLKIDKISKDKFKKINEDWFFKVLKTGFRHKRKKLLGNLGSLANPNLLKDIFQKLNLDLNIRAEELSVENWFELSEKLVERGPYV